MLGDWQIWDLAWASMGIMIGAMGTALICLMASFSDRREVGVCRDFVKHFSPIPFLFLFESSKLPLVERRGFPEALKRFVQSLVSESLGKEVGEGLSETRIWTAVAY